MTPNELFPDKRQGIEDVIMDTFGDMHVPLNDLEHQHVKRFLDTMWSEEIRNKPIWQQQDTQGKYSWSELEIVLRKIRSVLSKDFLLNINRPPNEQIKMKVIAEEIFQKLERDYRFEIERERREAHETDEARREGTEGGIVLRPPADVWGKGRRK